MPALVTASPDLELKPVAAVLAWVWPGLGHISLGERKRGFRIMFGVLFLFFGGLLVGGVDSVDRTNDTLWFCAQSACGPITFAADFANQSLVQRPEWNWRSDLDLRQRFLEGDPEILESLRRVGLGRVNEMGTLFIALAGLMNLVVMIDALCYRPFAVADHGRTATPGTDAAGEKGASA